MVAEGRKKEFKSKAEERAELISRIMKMKDQGYSNVAIGRAFKMSESSVRTLLGEAH